MSIEIIKDVLVIFMDEDDLISPQKRKKKIDDREKKKAKKDILGEKSVNYTYQNNNSDEED